MKACVWSIYSELPEDVREAFVELASLRGAIEETQRAIDELERQRQVFLQEQERLRDNLQRVPQGSDLAERYLEKLGEQEDGIEALLEEMEDLREALGVRQAALSDFVAELNI
jgi:chromosome segregation ATPase